MKIDLSRPVKTVYGNHLKRPSTKLMEAQSKFSQVYGPNWAQALSPEEKKEIEAELDVDMSLGYLLVEALPKVLDAKPSQHDVLAVGKLQRRVEKGGVQDFTPDEVLKLKKASCDFLAEREMFGVASIVDEMLTPELPPTEAL